MIRVEGYHTMGAGVPPPSAQGVLVDNNVSLYAICDGKAADGATAVTETAVLEAIRTMLGPLKNERGAPDTSVRMAIAAVRGAIRYACASVHRTLMEGSAFQDAGAAITLLVVHGDRAVVGHLGDSKLFLVRDGSCTELTRENDAGGKSSAKPNDSSSRTLVDVEVDTFQFEVLSGDRFLLCNRAFLNACDPFEPVSRALISAADPSELPNRLLYIAESQGELSEGAGVIVIQADTPPERQSEEQQRREEVILRIDSVKDVFLFKELALTELLEIADRAILLVPRANQIVVREGDEGDAMFVIIEGRCNVSVAGNIVAELGPGSHFGEMALLSNDPRSGTIATLDRSRMLRISREDFKDIIRLRPATGVKLLSALGRELSRRLAHETKRRG